VDRRHAVYMHLGSAGLMGSGKLQAHGAHAGKRRRECGVADCRRKAHNLLGNADVSAIACCGLPQGGCILAVYAQAACKECMPC